MPDIGATLGRSEARQARAEQGPERVDRPTAGLAHDGFECGEAQLDGVEVGAVGREEAQRRADGFNGVAYAGDFVSGEIVRDDDVTKSSGGAVRGTWPHRVVASQKGEANTRAAA